MKKEEINSRISRLYSSKSKYDLDEVAKKRNLIGIFYFIDYLAQSLSNHTHSPMINKKSVQILERKYKREREEKDENEK